LIVPLSISLPYIWRKAVFCFTGEPVAKAGYFCNRHIRVVQKQTGFPNNSNVADWVKKIYGGICGIAANAQVQMPQAFGQALALRLYFCYTGAMIDTTAGTEIIPLGNITVNDSFWSPFMERVRTTVIPYQWEALNDRIKGAEPSYCMRNFKLAAQRTCPGINYGVDNSVGHAGCVFQDSDAAKWIEAAAYTLVWHRDSNIEKTIDDAIDIICNAQQPDGYLNTYYIINGLEKRFTNLRDNHELYCFGHFVEAAVAYFQATGKRRLLDAMIRYADCIDGTFGPEAGKCSGYGGHEIAEMALVRLYDVSGDEKYLRLAKYFIDRRGQAPLFFAEEARRNGSGPYWKDSYFGAQYSQSARPVREQQAAEGHAVRAVYLYAGMADVARLAADDSLAAACAGLWNNITRRQMYITGVIGQAAYGESFTFDYDLPNDTVYGETCAAIGLVFFARRMAQLAPKGVYGDVMERALYNGIIGGMSLDGKSFFYVNPLEVIPESCLKDQARRHVKLRRQKWFGCACCPPNLARMIASIGGYIHTVNDFTIYTHLFIGSEAQITVGGTEIILNIETRYPWEPSVHISFFMAGSSRFTYAIRIPAWCGRFVLQLNGVPTGCNRADGFALLDREWQDGDWLDFLPEMPARFVEANPRVRENIGKLALVRGPVVYCLEEVDNGPQLSTIHVGNPARLYSRFEADTLGGLVCCYSGGKKEADWKDDTLYRPVQDTVYEDKALRWIPYYAWANRRSGEMAVWFPK
jgi:DUF1680 family protein